MIAKTIKILESLDSNITELKIEFKIIKGVLDLGCFTNLKKVDCSSNAITNIINLQLEFV